MIKKLNIENSVSILPLLSQSEIIELYKKCSLTFGYFKDNNSGIYHYPFSIMNALKTGSISISSIDRVAFQEVVGEEPFILKAFTEKDIEEQINFTFTNYNKVKNDFAAKGPLWVKKYHSKEFIIKRLLKGWIHGGFLVISSCSGGTSQLLSFGLCPPFRYLHGSFPTTVSSVHPSGRAPVSNPSVK